MEYQLIKISEISDFAIHDMKVSAADRQDKGETPAVNQAIGRSESGWQARKSANTRDQIVNAAILCICELGYSKTTTMKISEKIGLSRGATLHHFPSKMDIIRAVVIDLNEKRLESFRQTIKGVPNASDIPRSGVQLYWAQLHDQGSKALFELSLAARTDNELRNILRPVQLAFEQESYQAAWELSPEWHSDRNAFELARNLFQLLLEGMAISRMTHAREFDQEELFEYLEEKMRELNPSR